MWHINKILSILFLMVCLLVNAKDQNTNEDPNLNYIYDRKWDLKQMYMDRLPVDSSEVANLGMSFVFNTQNKAYQINFDGSTNSQIALVMDYTINASNNTMKLVKSTDLSILYNFQIVYIGKDHLVLAFSIPDPNNATLSKIVEYRFVADNSIYGSN